MKKYTPFVVLLALACSLLTFSLHRTAIADGIPYFDNLGSVNEGTVTGTTISKINPIATTFQKGITITNCDSSNALWVVPRPKGASKPTVSTNRFLFKIAAGDSIHVECGGGVDWYCLNSSGDTTATYYFVQGWR